MGDALGTNVEVLEGGHMENVVVLTFNAADEAHECFRSLQGLHETGNVRVEAAAVVERDADGRSIVPEVSEDTHARGAAAAGAIGAVLGLATGPVGVVVGGATGAVVGSLVDVADVDSTEQLLRALGHAIPAGSSAAVAIIAERTPAGVDQIASRLGGSLVRIPRRDLEAKLAEAEAEADEVARCRGAASERAIADPRRAIADRVRGQ